LSSWFLARIDLATSKRDVSRLASIPGVDPAAVRSAVATRRRLGTAVRPRHTPTRARSLGRRAGCDRLRHQVNAAAAVIAALHADNIALRQQLDHHDTMVSLDLRR
jgi:hypothetical protein